MPGQAVVNVDQLRAGSDHSVTVTVERNSVQARDIDDDAARRRVPAVAVSAGTGDDPHRVKSCPAHRALNVRRRLAENDRTRLHRIEARVEEQARLVVARSACSDDVAPQLVRELLVDSRRPRRGQLNEPSGERRDAGDECDAPSTRKQLAARQSIHAPNLASGC